MRILYAAQKHDYGDPQRGYSFEHYNFYNTLVNMNDKEHEIIYFPYDELITSLGPGAMNREFERLVDERQPEVVFIVLFTNEFEPATVRRISARRSTVTVAWMSDDHWRFENYGRHWAPAFNWVTTTDSRAVSKYHAAGYENAIKTQWACNHFLYKPTPSENGPYADLGVTFVGQPHGDRKQLIRAFLEVGISVACWGRGWPDGRVDQGDMLKVFANSKINLNLSNSSGGLSVKNIAKIFITRDLNNTVHLNSVGSWPENVRSIWSKRRKQIKGRNFEIPGCGGFLLTDDADDLGRYYTDGEEVVVFRDTGELLEKARYYLNHENERRRIAIAGYRRTLKEHTYEQRFNDIFSLM